MVSVPGLANRNRELKTQGMLDASYIESLRRDIEFDANLRGKSFHFKTTWGLFSPREIDAGTRLLVDRIELAETDHCLDLGCGYGAIGIALAACATRGQTMMVDKDFVAVDYAERNAALNGIANASAKLSNGFDGLSDQTFDVIASNLPAKVGKEMLYLYFYDAHLRLHRGGRLYVVTISGLRRFIERNFLEFFDNYTKVKQGKDHTVALAVKQ